MLSAGFAAVAVENIEVVGLFTNKAVLVIDGNRRVLGIGQTSPEGVTVHQVDMEKALLEIDGVKKEYSLGKSSVGTRYEKMAQKTVHVYKDAHGMYRTTGTVNGQTVDFLVDTGASLVAMNTSQARRLGIRYLLKGKQGAVVTASGVVNAYYVKLDSVAVGAIKLHNIDGVIITGNGPLEILLGMSFLSRLTVEHSGQLMVLTATR